MGTSYDYGARPGEGTNKENLRGGRKAPSKRRSELTENTDPQNPEMGRPIKKGKPYGKQR